MEAPLCLYVSKGARKLPASHVVNCSGDGG